MHICIVTVALHTNILLISHFAPFFSLFSIYKTNSSIFSPSSSSSSSHTHKHTHTRGHTKRPSIAKSTQTHHPHRPNTTKSTTNTPQNQPKIKHIHTGTNQQRQRELFCELVAVGWCLEGIKMFGSTGTNLCGLMLVVNRCLWISEFQPQWIDAWIIDCDREWGESFRWERERERLSNREERELR